MLVSGCDTSMVVCDGEFLGGTDDDDDFHLPPRWTNIDDSPSWAITDDFHFPPSWTGIGNSHLTGLILS